MLASFASKDNLVNHRYIIEYNDDEDMTTFLSDELVLLEYKAIT